MLIHVPAPDSPRDDIALADIEDPLIDVLAGSGAGELDGNEVSLQDGSAVIYLYGPDADRLFATIEPTLRKLPLPPGTYAVKQYGEPGARESRVPLR